MSFFDSDVVRAEMTAISEIQDDVYKNVFKFPSMDKEEKLEHVGMLETLLEKQKILYARLSLSDDPEAKLMKENIIKSAKQLGFPSDVDLGYVFSNMSAIIDTMKKSIREGS